MGSKCQCRHASTSTFSGLLRQSRLPRSLVSVSGSKSLPADKSSSDRTKPTKQVITSTPASNYRRDYGLKRAMPHSMHPNHITVHELDTPYGFADYSGGSSKAMILNRLRSLNVAVTPVARRSRERPELSALFHGRTHTFDKHKPPSQWFECHSLGIEFASWLQHQHRKEPRDLRTLSDLELGAIIDEFSSSKQKQKSSAKKVIDKTPVATAGLSYTLPGCAFNTPRGITNISPVEGRILDRQGRMVAASGLVSVAELGSLAINSGGPGLAGIRARKQVHLFSVQQLRVDPKTGGASMHLRPQHRDRPDSQLAARNTNRVQYTERPDRSATQHEQDNTNELYKLIKTSLFN